MAVIDINTLTTSKTRTVLRPIETTRAQADDLARVYMTVVRAWDEGRAVIMAEYERSLARALMTDSADDLQATVESVENGAVRAALTAARSLFRQWADNISTWHLRRFIASLTYATNVQAGTVLQSVLAGQPATVEDLVARNVSLIRDVSDVTRGRIADAVLRGLQARTPTRDVARELREITGMSRARSLRIASDQTVKLSAALDRERQVQIGITSFEWRHSGKLHYRPEHKARNGRIFSWSGDVARNDPPGFAPFCFPSGQPVTFHDDIFTFWRRFHRGELTTFVTESGETISATPNHPILTESGWKAAKMLEIGDNIVAARDCGVYIYDVDIHERQPLIGNLFEASKALYGSISVNGSGAEFHGDSSVDEQIEVVNIQGGLRNNIKSLTDENFIKFLLKEAFFGGLASRAFELFGVRGKTSGASDVRSLSLLESLLWGEFGPFETSRLALVSQLHTEFLEPCYQRWSSDTESFRKRVGMFAAHVSTGSGLNIELLSVVCAARDILGGDEIPPSAEIIGQHVSVNTQESGGIGQTESVILNEQNCRIKSVVTRGWEGHVYNFETVSGWYAAGSIAVKNCGCKALGVIGDPENG